MINPPRALSLTIACVGAVAGTALAGGVSAGLGGSILSIQAAALCVLGACALTCWSALLRGPLPMMQWGTMVLGGSIMRMMAVLGIGLGIDVSLAVSRTPFWMGVLSGAVLVLVIETVMLIMTINATGRENICAGGTGPVGSA